MKTKIQIEVKNNYGVANYYPTCSTGKCFARIAGTKTLTIDAINTIISMGYEIETVDVAVRDFNNNFKEGK